MSITETDIIDSIPNQSDSSNRRATSLPQTITEPIKTTLKSGQNNLMVELGLMKL